jgi:hypothetical protein
MCGILGGWTRNRLPQMLIDEASRSLGKKLETFTVSMSDAEFEEAPIAERTARAIGIKNTVLKLHIQPEKVILPN